MILAKELGLCYAALALVTDYDSWKDEEEAVRSLDILCNHPCLWGISIESVDLFFP